MIYLDNAATTFPKPEAVYKAMDNMNRTGAVNAGRGSYKAARIASSLISNTKQQLRDLIQVDSTTAVVFTPSITIAINQIVNGLNLRNNAIIYISPYEHNAVARSLHELSKKENIIIKQLPLDDNFEINLDKMKYEFLIDKPDVVFCNHVSNVTGYILPVKEIFSESKKYKAINILDTAQSLGLIDIQASLLNVDLLAFAGHKNLYGPFGIGGFINITGIPLDVFISGGTGSDSLNLEMPEGIEAKYESSSNNIIAITGLNASLASLDVSRNYLHEKELTKYLIDKLSAISEVKMYLPANLENHIGIVSFNVEGFKADDIGMILDEDFDIAVRTGYHCAPFIHSHLKDLNSLGTVRVSVSCFSNTSEIDQLCEALLDIVGGI